MHKGDARTYLRVPRNLTRKFPRRPTEVGQGSASPYVLKLLKVLHISEAVIGTHQQCVCVSVTAFSSFKNPGVHTQRLPEREREREAERERRRERERKRGEKESERERETQRARGERESERETERERAIENEGTRQHGGRYNQTTSDLKSERLYQRATAVPCIISTCFSSM